MDSDDIVVSGTVSGATPEELREYLADLFSRCPGATWAQTLFNTIDHKR